MIACVLRLINSATNTWFSNIWVGCQFLVRVFRDTQWARKIEFWIELFGGIQEYGTVQYWSAYIRKFNVTCELELAVPGIV